MFWVFFLPSLPISSLEGDSFTTTSRYRSSTFPTISSLGNVVLYYVHILVHVYRQATLHILNDLDFITNKPILATIIILVKYH